MKAPVTVWCSAIHLHCFRESLACQDFPLAGIKERIKIKIRQCFRPLLFFFSVLTEVVNQFIRLGWVIHSVSAERGWVPLVWVSVIQTLGCVFNSFPHIKDTNFRLTLALPGMLQVRNRSPGRTMCPWMLQDEWGWCPAPKPVYRRLLWWLRGLYPHVQCSANSSLKLSFPSLYNIPLPDCSDSKTTSLRISTLQKKSSLCFQTLV